MKALHEATLHTTGRQNCRFDLFNALRMDKNWCGEYNMASPEMRKPYAGYWLRWRENTFIMGEFK